jgi:hypothetical protein
MARTEAWIRDSNGFQQIYWIDRRATTIVGWFGTPRMMNGHLGIGPDERPDLHFTYPASGDFHFSLKTKCEDGELDRISRVYADRIEEVVLGCGKRSKRVFPRGDDPDCFGFLVPRFRPPAFKDYSDKRVRFSFATTGFNIVSGQVIASALCRLPKRVAAPKNALVIDAATLGTGGICVGACLTGKGTYSSWPETETVASRIDDSAYPRIELYGVFTPS